MCLHQTPGGILHRFEIAMNACVTSLWRDVALFHQKLTNLSGPGALKFLFLRMILTAIVGSKSHSSSEGGGTLLAIASLMSFIQLASLFPVPFDSQIFRQKTACSFNYHQNIHRCHGDPSLSTTLHREHSTSSSHIAANLALTCFVS